MRPRQAPGPLTCVLQMKKARELPTRLARPWPPQAAPLQVRGNVSRCGVADESRWSNHPSVIS